jgi:hypothetical protein
MFVGSNFDLRPLMVSNGGGVSNIIDGDIPCTPEKEPSFGSVNDNPFTFLHINYPLILFMQLCMEFLRRYSGRFGSSSVHGQR